MGAFGQPPGTPSEPLPSPVADHVEIGKDAAVGQQESGWFGKLLQAIVSGIRCAPAVIIAGIVDTFDRIFVILGRFSLKAQGEQSPEFIRLAGTMVGDLLGKEPDLDAFSSSVRAGGRIAGMEALGDLFISTLASEFVANGGLSEEQGQRAMRSLAGFMMSFGVRESNVGILLQLLPSGVLQQFREMGVHVAENLGLGRLARLGLRPLFEILVAKPTEWDLNRKYRPTVLPEKSAVQAFVRGMMDEARLRLDLARKGFRDDDINTLILENQRQLSEGEVLLLHRWGFFDDAEATRRLKLTGAAAETQIPLFAHVDRARADKWVEELLAALRKSRVAGFLDAPTFRAVVDVLPLADEERTRYLNVVGQDVETPRKRLSFAELHKAFLSGIVDLDFVDEWFKLEGYDSDSAHVLTLQILLDLNTEEAKKEARKRKEAAAAAKKAKRKP